jgi:glycosyltransferase involved in cell wall biosynthesis
MKKLALIQDYHFNFYYTAKELSKKYNLYLIGTPYRDLPKFIQLNKWKTKIFLKNSLRLYFGNILKLNKHLKNKDFAIIKDFSQPKSLIAILMCRLKNIKYLVVIQKLNWTKYKFLSIIFKILISLLIKKNTPIISSIKEGKEKAKKYFNNVTYIPFAIEEKNKTKKFNKKSKTLKILTVGKLSQKRKDHILLIQALNEIQLKEQTIELTIIGRMKIETDYYKKLIKEIKSSKIKIIIKKNLDIKQMENEYLNADLFILPSYREPVGYAILEAMACGLPIICSDDIGAKCYLNKNGAIFTAKNKLSLKKSILDIAISKNNEINWNNLEKLGKRSIYIVKNNHDPKIITNKFEKIIDESLK